VCACISNFSAGPVFLLERFLEAVYFSISSFIPYLIGSPPVDFKAVAAAEASLLFERYFCFLAGAAVEVPACNTFFLDRKLVILLWTVMAVLAGNSSLLEIDLGVLVFTGTAEPPAVASSKKTILSASPEIHHHPGVAWRHRSATVF
jgi:hypothetical protein